MNNNEKPLNGVPAVYTEYGGGIPFRDALPPFRNEEEIIELFLFSPEVPKNLEAYSEIERFIMINRIDEFRVPSLEIKKLAFSLYALLEEATAHMTESLYWLKEASNSQQRTGRRSRQATTGSMLLMGMSGVGKTTAIEEILLDMPQVILHENYHGHKFIADQIVYLIVDCPPKATLTGFLRQILLAIDEALGNTHYFKDSLNRKTRCADLLPVVVKLLWEHHVGVLVLDEINHLAGAGMEQEALSNTLTTLTNMAHTPVVFCGTYRFKNYVERNFRDTRRFLKWGDPGWNRLKEDDAEWDFFVQELWELQYTLTKTELTDELAHILYEGSQGIKAIAVALFKQVQREVILDERNKEEKITINDFHKVIKTDFSKLEPMLKAIRDNDVRKMLEYEDLYEFTEQIEVNSQKALERYEKEKRIFDKNIEKVKTKRQNVLEETFTIVDRLLTFKFLDRQEIKKIIKSKIQSSSEQILEESELKNSIIKELLEEEQRRAQLKEEELEQLKEKLSLKEMGSLQQLYSDKAEGEEITYSDYQMLGKIGSPNEF